MAEALVRFGVFADPHYAEKVYGDRHCEDSADKLRACVEVFRDAELDFAVCMGDLIDSAEEREAEAGYATTMAGIFAGFGGPRHWVLGNHDVDGLSKGEFLKLCGARYPPYYSFDCKGVHFALLDGNCHEDGTDFRPGANVWDEAWISQRQVEWLRCDLGAASGRQAIVLCHENLDDRQYREALDPHVVRDAAQVRDVLESVGHVSAVITAHYHPGLVARQGGIPYLALRSMVVGAGLENNAFAVVTVEADGTVAVDGHGQQESCRMRAA